MSILSSPQALIELRITKYPASSGTTVVRAGYGPISVPGAFFQPRLKSIESITRAATDPDGNYTVGSSSCTLIDEDGELAALLDEGQETEYWVSREYIVYYPSQEKLDSHPTISDLQPVFRGWITNVQCSNREVTIEAADVVGAQMSASNLDRKALQIQFKDVATTPLEDTKNEFFNIFIGEYSDRGAHDANGNPVLRGIVSAKELCEIDISDITGTPVPTFADPPVITFSGVTGTSGEETIYYGATTITPYGQSMMSNIVAVNGAARANRNVSNYNEISGTFPIGPDPLNPYKVLIWVGTSLTNMVGWLDEANYNGAGIFGYFDGAAAWPTATRNELDVIKYEAPPPTSTAQTNEGIFSIMVLALSYGYTILDIFASDLAELAEPKRAVIEAAEHGVTTITPDDAEWPFPNPWIEMNNVRFFGFLQRGPKLEAHRRGDVTMAVNMCGPLGIDQAFYQLQFLLNEFCVKNNGTGYRNHTFGAPELYADGTPLVKPSSYAACQDITKGWLENDTGYQGNIFVVDPEETWRDVIQKVCISFGCRMAATRFGQIFAFLINTETDGYAGRHFRERIEIKRTEDPILAHDQVVNKAKLSFFYDVDAGDFRGKEIPITNEESVAAHVAGGVVGGTDRRGERPKDFNLYYTAYSLTAYDVVERELLRRKRRPRYPSVTVPLLGLDFDIGDRGQLTDSHGLGPLGDVATPVTILGHTIHPDDEEVTLIFQDRRGISTGTNPELGDETDEDSMEELGDEESVPPTAREVG